MRQRDVTHGCSGSVATMSGERQAQPRPLCTQKRRLDRQAAIRRYGPIGDISLIIRSPCRPEPEMTPALSTQARLRF